MRRAVIVLALLVSARAFAEGNPYLGRAKEYLEELKYDKANEALDQALKFGANGPAELVQIYRMWGEVAAALGDAADAEKYFTRLLSLEPSAALPEGVSPKISAPFDAARA